MKPIYYKKKNKMFTSSLQQCYKGKYLVAIYLWKEYSYSLTKPVL